MGERLEFELAAKDKSTKQFRSVEAEVKRLNKTVAAGTSGSKAAAASLKQLRQAADSLGVELAGDTVPAANAAAGAIRNSGREAARAGAQLHQLKNKLGLTRSGADAFTRAATRTVGAIGFISPTAATASAQLVGLTNASAGMALALGAGAVGAIALGTALIGSSKAAINFETSFRGIRKTVDATEAEYAQLESQNRKLAISLGENVNTINAMGQAAGQLGVAIGDLARFEQVVIELAAASDITAKAAAFSFGGLMKVLRLTVEDVDRLSDEIVALGNTFPAMESEIVGLMSRIAGAGAILKVPAADLVAIAAAFSSVRVEQEAAGTAIQKVMLAIQRAAVVGGKELQTFSKMMGITASEFQKLVRTDPTKVFVRFVEALGKSGEEAQLWLKELGLTDQRLTRTFLKMASAQGLLTEVMAAGNKAYQEGTARTVEFEKALATTAGQIRIAKASFIDLGISVGTVLLPAITAAAQAAKEFADGLRIAGDAAIAVKGPLEAIGIDFGVIGKSFVENLTPATQAFGIISDAADLFGGSSDEAAEAVGSLGDATTGANDAAATYQDTLSDLEPDITSVGDAADEARDKLFGMFKAPTVEEAKAKLALLGLKKELNDIQTLLRPLTEAEKDRADVLKKYLIPSAQRLIEQERLYGDILAQQYTIALGALQTRQQMEEAVAAQAREVAILNAEMRETPAEIKTEIEVISVGVEVAQEAIEALLARGDHLAAQDFAFNIDTLGEEQALEAIDALLEAGNFLAAQTFAFSVRIDGFERAMAQITALLRAGQLFAGMELGFGVTTGGGGGGLSGFLQSAFDRVRELLATAYFLPDPDEVFPDSQSMRDLADSAAKAKKAVDPLADGIISLAEALEFGISMTQAATMELGFEQEKLADRLWRTRVETEKLTRFYTTNAAIMQRVMLELAEAEVEATKKSVELRVEREKTFQRLASSTYILQQALLELQEAEVKAGQKTLALQVELAKLAMLADDASVIFRAQRELHEIEVEVAKAALDLRVEFAKLDIILAEQGLTGQAATFHHALRDLSQGFRTAEESILGFLDRLAQASLDAVRQSFEGLFARPTREQAAQELQLARLRAERQRLFVGGRTEDELAAFLKPLDLEIAAIEASLAIRQSELDVLRAQGVVADQTLMTDRELLSQGYLLIGFIATQSAITSSLNDALALEQLWRARAIDGLQSFTDALTAASSVVGGRGSITINVSGATSREDVVRLIADEADRALRRAGMGGSFVTTGAFVP